MPCLGLGRLLVPGAVAPGVTAIPAEALRARGIHALIVDLDNTLTRWNESGCPPAVAAWLRGLKEGGTGVCIVSNNGPERVRGFCAGLGMDLVWIAHAGKPALRAYREAQARLGVGADEVAVIGDQIFTDVFGGNRAGLFTVLVQPLGRREFPATRVVRLVERAWLRRLERRGALMPRWAPPSACARPPGRPHRAGRTGPPGRRPGRAPAAAGPQVGGNGPRG